MGDDPITVNELPESDANSDTQLHGKDVFEYGDTVPLNTDETVQVFHRDVVRYDGDPEQLYEQGIVSDEIDVPASYNESVQKGVYVILTIEVPEGYTKKTTATRLASNTSFYESEFGLPEVSTRIEPRDMGSGSADISFSSPSVGSRSMTAEEAESVARIIRDNASNSGFQKLLAGADNTEEAELVANALEKAAHVKRLSNRLSDDTDTDTDE